MNTGLVHRIAPAAKNLAFPLMQPPALLQLFLQSQAAITQNTRTSAIK